MQILNQPITLHQLKAFRGCRHDPDDLLKFRPSIRIRTKVTFRDFKHGVVDDGLWGLQRMTAALWVRMFCWCPRSEKNGQPPRASKKATVAEIISCYSKDTQTSISEHATHVEPWSWWTTAAEDPSECHSCQEQETEVHTVSLTTQ